MAFIKLRLNSASSASHCRGITSLINTPKKWRIFDAPKKRNIFDLRSYVLFLNFFFNSAEAFQTNLPSCSNIM
ncbi:MAG TPA: hypothetical protein VGD14_10475, partial [bacterium]